MRKQFTVKQGVSLEGMHPIIYPALYIMESLYRDRVNGENFVITSASEMSSAHKEGSKHYEGKAVDIRIWGFTQEQAHEVVKDANYWLSPILSVILEKDHIHMHVNI